MLRQFGQFLTCLCYESSTITAHELRSVMLAQCKKGVLHIRNEGRGVKLLTYKHLFYN